MPTASIKPMKPWFQTIEDVGSSLNWREFFGNDQPVELDIGCGRGLFLFNAALTTPYINFVGMEIDYREGRRTATRLMKQNLPNARVIGGDCRTLLSRLITTGSVQAAHVYFPDPWWKTRQDSAATGSGSSLDGRGRLLRNGTGSDGSSPRFRQMPDSCGTGSRQRYGLPHQLRTQETKAGVADLSRTVAATLKSRPETSQQNLCR